MRCEARLYSSVFLFLFLITALFIDSNILSEIDVTHALIVALFIIVFSLGRCVGHEYIDISGIRVCSDDLWVTLLLERALIGLDHSLDDSKCLLKLLFSLISIVSHYLALVVRWRDHLELQFPCVIINLVLSSEESLLDCLNAVVDCACKREVHTDLKWVNCELTGKAG